MEKENIHFDRKNASIDTSSLKVRCPQCFKLYNIDVLSISTNKPKFQCTQCEEKFSLSISDSMGLDEVIGFAESWEEEVKEPIDAELPQVEMASITSTKVEVKSDKPVISAPPTVEVDTKPCPKCGAPNPVGAKDCGSCQIIFEKYEEQKKDPIGSKAPQKLKEIWQMVLNHYEDEDLHHEFIRQCRKAKEMEYAASRYRRILEGQPSEEIAKRFQKEIQLLTEVINEPRVRPNKDKPKFRIPFVTLAMLLSSIIMFTGYFVPELRNLMGIGAAFLFITTAIRLIFK